MKIWLIGFSLGRLVLRLKFVWYRFWIGFDYDPIHGILSVILIPTLVLEIRILPTRG